MSLTLQNSLIFGDKNTTKFWGRIDFFIFLRKVSYAYQLYLNFKSFVILIVFTATFDQLNASSVNKGFNFFSFFSFLNLWTIVHMSMSSVCIFAHSKNVLILLHFMYDIY